MVPLPEPSLTYFTCTLGQAAKLNALKPHNFSNINEFIDEQARLYPDHPAVAFPVPRDGDEDWIYELFSFEDLRNGSAAIASELSSLVVNGVSSGKICAALLCSSSVDFLFAWLGLMKLGASVLLIAPQCQPQAIAHLCKSCDVETLLYDATFSELALSSSSISDSKFAATLLPWQNKGNRNIEDIIRTSKADSGISPRQIICPTPHDTAYIHHTSGTSTGLPKPIPQSHNAAIGVLPSLDIQNEATFTTTPLYHGGIADCFRAWTSRALIWLFPGARIPITTNNIISCLETAADASQEEPKMPKVKYFSSVPYVLQMLSEDPEGLNWLQKMDLVGVGGAALPVEVGNTLVENGVNLLSRFGSAECGFLLSSHRDYSTDKDWQYLRLPPQSQSLKFEAQKDESDLSELIVLKTWPHMAKVNRQDGSFATSDLFESHPKIKNAWRYHSRSDSQITLITGKKFDPAPVEEAITSKSRFIKEVLVFGNGKQVPGALVFIHNGDITDLNGHLNDHVWRLVDEANRQGQEHTRISKEMVVVLQAESKGLDRSSKGTVLRNVAEKRFEKEIEAAYHESEDEEDVIFNEDMDYEEVKSIVRDTISDVLGGQHTLSDETDFYRSGMDSATCVRIRALLQKKTKKNISLPWNIVYDCGNIDRLAKYFVAIQHGSSPLDDSKSEEQYMLDLVEKYSTFVSRESTRKHTEKKKRPRVVLLSGATGALGAHILDILRSDSSVDQIICCVRSTDDLEAQKRVNSSLVQRRKEPLSASNGRILCRSTQLGKADLGLSSMMLEYIRERLTHVIHAAWTVNFSLPLRSFEADNIAGVHNLINLCLSSQPHPAEFIFCSSTASVLSSPLPPETSSSSPLPIREAISISPADAAPLGYAQSKWVAEQICHHASSSVSSPSQSSNSRNDFKSKILRIGQLTGDTKHGVWNITEAWPLMLSTVQELRALPDLGEEEVLDWLPVDVAARGVVDVAFAGGDASVSESAKPEEGEDAQPGEEEGEEKEEKCKVYHILNSSCSGDQPQEQPTWTTLLHTLTHLIPYPFAIVPPATWLQRLESLESDHPAKKLLGLWKGAYGGADIGSDTDFKGEGYNADGEKEGEKKAKKKKKKQKREFETKNAEGVSEVLRRGGEQGQWQWVDGVLFKRVWEWLVGEMERR